MIRMISEPQFPWLVVQWPIDSSGPPAHVWRSVLGRQLRKNVCVTRMPSCNGCTLFERCDYPVFFEQTTVAHRPHEFPPVPPRPYALHVRSEGAGDILRLTLVGRRAISRLPLLIGTLESGAKQGVGRDRKSIVLSKPTVKANRYAHPNMPADLNARILELPQVPHRVRLHLDSPLRLVRLGQRLGAETLTAGALEDALVHRVRTLAWGIGVEIPDRPAPKPEIAVEEADLTDSGARRFSARQKQTMSLNGVTGTLTLGGDGLPTIWPWLWAGQYLQLGKSTTQGLGAYRLSVPLE